MEDLIHWDYDSNAIKLVPYYQQLLKWCDSVDVIRSQPYSGKVIRYPVRELDTTSCDNASNLLVDEAFKFNEINEPSGGNNFVMDINDLNKKIVHTNSLKLSDKKGNKRVRCTADRVDTCAKKANNENTDNDCKIVVSKGVHGPHRIAWPEFRHHQIDENWQRNVCIRMGLPFVRVFECQAGGVAGADPEFS